MSQLLNPNLRGQSSTCLSKQETTRIPSVLYQRHYQWRDLVSYQYQSEASTIDPNLKGMILNLFRKTKRLLSRSKQYRVLFKLSTFFSLD